MLFSELYRLQFMLLYSGNWSGAWEKCSSMHLLQPLEESYFKMQALMISKSALIESRAFTMTWWFIKCDLYEKRQEFEYDCLHFISQKEPTLLAWNLPKFFWYYWMIGSFCHWSRVKCVLKLLLKTRHLCTWNVYVFVHVTWLMELYNMFVIMSWESTQLLVQQVLEWDDEAGYNCKTMAACLCHVWQFTGR